jgi:UDP-2,3-diacylglucosamine hydrolase
MPGIMGNIYFASDFHLGVDAGQTSVEREREIVRWLDAIRSDAEAIYLVGDIFDYWFEYREAVPRGFTRLLGKLAELRDAGIAIYAFTGNHDMWMFGYFKDELDIPVHKEPIEVMLGEHRVIVGHGDGLGPGDHGYKFIKRVFASRICQWLFARIHPNLGIRLMRYFSQTSRNMTSVPDFLGWEKEWLISYCLNTLKSRDVKYFIFGHRHLPLDIDLGKDGARYINLGDWLTHYTFAVFDGRDMTLMQWDRARQVMQPVQARRSIETSDLTRS